ncbi:MAG: hypothetical protein KAS62_07990, partial [Candidatus Delongbacteria bacterium]|nr:hypothetical protein [Candidatus Delongbacteria bacterium]
MRKLVLMLILVSLGFVYAQEDYADLENDIHSTDTTADEIINNEPIVVAEIIGSTGNDTPDNTPEQDMTASAEMYYTKFYKKLSVPLWYRWKDFSFNASVPFFLSKEEIWSGETVSGLGDISVGAGYGKYLAEYNTYFDFNFTAKLPTGGEEEAGGFKVQLGTETLDLTGAASAYYFMDEFTFKGIMVYTMNGEYENDWDQKIDRGDNFLFSAGADYRWLYRLVFGLNANYGIHFNSDYDGTEGIDKFVF